MRLLLYLFATLIDNINIHFEFRSAELLLNDHAILPLIEQLISLKPAHTGNDLRAILRNIIDLDDALNGAILLQCLGVKHIDFQLKRSVHLRAFGGLVAELDEDGFGVGAFDLGVGFDF